MYIRCELGSKIRKMVDICGIEEMVEPLEETRTELVFATEPVISSLHLSIPGSLQFTPLVELDEVEVRLPSAVCAKVLIF